MTAKAERELVVGGAGGFGRETDEAVRAPKAAGGRWWLAEYLNDRDPSAARQEGPEEVVRGSRPCVPSLTLCS
jgi:hypothetical protein